MDPKACWERIIGAVADQDYDEAADALDDLAGWVSRGGYRPKEVPEYVWDYRTLKAAEKIIQAFTKGV